MKTVAVKSEERGSEKRGSEERGSEERGRVEKYSYSGKITRRERAKKLILLRDKLIHLECV